MTIGGSCEQGFKQADTGCYGVTLELADDGQDEDTATTLCKKLHPDALVMPQAQYCDGDADKIKERYAAITVLKFGRFISQK